ncbi:MAG TPA: hypothetical protein VFE53_17965 [Mucilaginibacter sp.]|jgi:hypothetical protein|nr:hypothetical protein [Mucilaginibacter sp.]
MKKLVLFLFLAYSGATFAQEKYGATTHQFSVSGKIKNPSVITMDSLVKYAVVSVGDINVTDHTGAFKHKDAQLKGVLLKDILSHTMLDAASPKLYSAFYYTCVGSDGYKVVYSWNELFNTEVGNHVYIVMEKNGVKADQLPESIQMTSTMDVKTGRRYLHNLDKIIVSEAN